MKKPVVYLAAVLAAAMGLAVPGAQANERYGQRPPVVLSPDLSATWTLQLGGATAPRGGAVVRAPRMQRQAQPRNLRRSVFTTRAAAPSRIARPQVQRPVRMAAPRAAQRPRIAPQYLPQTVTYQTSEKRGSIVIDTNNRFLYLVLGDGKARRYGVGVGKPGFEWAGTHRVTRKAHWPDWRPPQEMIRRVRLNEGRILPAHMEGGPDNPLGARALYLGSTLYRIHGTNQPWTIGGAVSSGCIRMRNEDVIDLYERVGVGAKVTVI